MCMKKASTPSGRFHADLTPDVHQLVVLYPDHVAGVRGFERDSGKTLIDA